MKRYKRLALAMLALALLVVLSGCIIIPVSKYYRISPEEVTSVQFYDLRNEETVISYHFEKNYDPAYTLPEKDIEAFLSDFSELRFSKTILIVPAAVDPSFSYGNLVVRINFSDGKYTLYSSAGFGETFDAKGECISTSHYGCDEEDLESLVNKYYETQ